MFLFQLFSIGKRKQNNPIDIYLTSTVVQYRNWSEIKVGKSPCPPPPPPKSILHERSAQFIEGWMGLCIFFFLYGCETISLQSDTIWWDLAHAKYNYYCLLLPFWVSFLNIYILVGLYHTFYFFSIYVVVQFYPWHKYYFPLFQTHHHTLPYPRTIKIRKIKLKPRINLKHNTNT